MKLSKKFDRILACLALLMLGLVFVNYLESNNFNTYAEGEEREIVTDSDEHYVTIYDDGDKLTIKTDAKTVSEAIERAGILLNSTDSVEPSLDDEINSDNYHINIYRSSPIVLIDGNRTVYAMTSSRELKTIFEDAGIDVYDGDDIQQSINYTFLETGIATAYEVIRNGGETITVEEEIPFEEERITDFNMYQGTSEVRQLGEVGRKTVVYKVKSIDGEEKTRELVSETVIAEPVKRIVAVGVRVDGETTAEQNEEITWNYLRGQGFSEVQTAGIMGNLQQEHHFYTTDTSGGMGIAQWTSGRRNNLLAKTEPFSIYTQLEYLMEELNGSYYRVKSNLLLSTSIEDATRVFQNQFEKCGICREETRINYAYQIYERYRQK